VALQRRSDPPPAPPVARPRPAGQLTGDEVALVLHRAAEIETAEGDASPDRYDPAAVEEAAAEVGLSPAAVRRAVAELRVGALPAEPSAEQGRTSRAAVSRRVCDQRLVDRSPEAALATIDRFLRTQMFESRRRSGDRSLYRPRSDLMAGLRRKLDFAGAIKIEGLSLVDVVVTPTDDGTLVRVEAELTSSRANVLAGSAAAGAGTTLVTGLIGAIAVEPALLIASVPMGVMIGGGSARVATARWQRRRDDVAEVLAGLLDSMQTSPH
jgi:transposase-like protein